MKRLVLVLVIVGFALSPIMAQNPMVKVNPDPVVRVNSNVNVDQLVSVAVETISDLDIDIDFGWGDYDDTETYQQETQEMEIPLTKPGERGKLNVESHNGEVTIKAYSGNTVKVKMIKYSKKVDRDSNKSGMRLLSTGGFSVQAEEYNNTIKLENEGWNNRVDFEIQVPANFDVSAETYNNGNIVIEGVNGELNVESYNGPITLTNISGSASASTYNGTVIASFAQVTPDAPMIFGTYNGNVELTLPAGTKISTKMRTNRDIYTDFESFSLKQTAPTTEKGKEGKGYKVKYENWVEGDLNGGGAEVTMKTHNGNIYIRKG